MVSPIIWVIVGLIMTFWNGIAISIFFIKWVVNVPGIALVIWGFIQLLVYVVQVRKGTRT
jgi:hypothetical protein